MKLLRLCECIAGCADIALANTTRSEANTTAAAQLAKAIDKAIDKARFANPYQASACAEHPPGSAQATSSIVAAQFAKATVGKALVPDSATSQAPNPPSSAQAGTSIPRPLPLAQLAQTIVDRARFRNPHWAHSQPQHPPGGTQATSSISGGKAAAQVVEASSPASSTVPQTQAAKPGATAARGPHSGVTSTAPFTSRASLQHCSIVPQQAATAQPPAETKQIAPAQHSLLHRGTLSDLQQAQSAQHAGNPSRGLLADPASAAGTGQNAREAALQTAAADSTQGVLTQPPLPQQWSASNSQLAYAAFEQHMSKYIDGATTLDTAVGLVFPHDALQHQLDQQFMEHARSRCQLISRPAQPQAALPYSQSSEAPNTWRAAVLGFLDWLMEAHYQGIVARHRGATQQCVMLSRSLSVQLERLQVRLGAESLHSAAKLCFLAASFACTAYKLPFAPCHVKPAFIYKGCMSHECSRVAPLCLADWHPNLPCLDDRRCKAKNPFTLLDCRLACRTTVW